LRKIDNLKKYLDFPPILEVGKKIAMLDPIDLKSEDVLLQFTDQNENVRNLIQLNNQYINALNNRFLYLEALVTLLEKQKAKA